MALLGSLLSGGLGLVSSLAGGLLGKSSQDKANQTNIDLTRETNALNERLFYANMNNQNVWNERAYEEYWKQRQYDSIANQRAQYENAGINPYFALGNMQTGQAAGSTPSPSGGVGQPSMSTVQVMPYDPASSIAGVGEAVARGVSDYYQNAKLHADTVNQQLRNLTQLNRDLGELDERIANVKQKGADTSKLEAERETIVKSRDLLLSNLFKQGRLLDAQREDTMASRNLKDYQAINTQVMTRAQELQNELFSDTKEWQRKRIIFGVRQILSEIRLNSASAAFQIANRFYTLCAANGIRIDNFHKNQLNWLIRDGVKLDNMLKRQDLGLDNKWYTGKYNPLNTLFNGLVGIGTSIAGGYAAGAAAGAGMRVGKPHLGPKLLNQYGSPMY